MNKQSINLCKVLLQIMTELSCIVADPGTEQRMLELVARWHLLIYDLFLQSGGWRVGNECIVPFATPP